MKKLNKYMLLGLLIIGAMLVLNQFSLIPDFIFGMGMGMGFGIEIVGIFAMKRESMKSRK